MARETIANGSSGADVTELQNILSGLGFAPGAIDGVFGEQTEAAVHRFQEARGVTADGVVGEGTWAQVDANVAEANAAGVAQTAAAAKAEADAKAAADAQAAAEATAKATADKAAAEQASWAAAAQDTSTSSIMDALKGVDLGGSSQPADGPL